MTDLIAQIREVIDQHAKCDGRRRLGLKRESADNVRKAVSDEVRYVSALFDEELTVLEGAE